MKEVKFREYRQTGAFICGVFILLCFTVLILIFLTEPPANTRIDVILYCFLILILFLTIGISCIYFSFLPKVGIKSIRIDDTTMIITSYDENKKEVLTKILLKDILSFKFDMKCDYDYKKLPYDPNRLDLIITVNIECANEENYDYAFHTEDYAKIKQMFSVAKYIPNFSYTVATNSQEVHKNIEHLAHTGKNLPVKEYIKTLLENPEVSKSTKLYVKFSVAAVIIYILYLIALFYKGI